MTLNYNFNEMMPLPLCYYYLKPSESNQYDCPGDGSYGFSVNYILPGAGGQSSSWLATGWAGTGTISIFAESNENMMIGQCTFNLKTYVTPDPERGIFQTPSAAASVGMLGGSVAALVLICFWMRCCRRSSGHDTDDEGAKLCQDDVVTQLSADDISTLFKRLDEETRSQLSTDSKRMFSGMVAPNPCGPCGELTATDTNIEDPEDQFKPVEEVKPTSNRSIISAMAI